jgi:hypothetical protein
MKHYLLAMHYPDGPPPPDIDMDRVMSDLAKINEDMRAAGQWVFANGLHDSTTATVVRVEGGEMLTTDGPYLEGKEHLGGFTITKVPDLDAALGWARRIAEATGLPIEVRPFHD